MDDLTDLEVDVAAGQPAGTALVQEVDVFNEETEEGNHNLEEKLHVSFTSSGFGLFEAKCLALTFSWLLCAVSDLWVAPRRAVR